MATLQWISERWLNSQRTTLAHTAKTLKVTSPDFSACEDGSDPIYSPTGETQPNPAYERLVRKIEAAEYHLATIERIIEKAKTAKFRVASYAGRCCKTDAEVKAGAGFVRQENGRWKPYSTEAVCDELGIKIEGLPEIED